MELKVENEITCPNCGYQLRAEDYYCPSCRHRVEFIQAAKPEAVAPDLVVEKARVSRNLEVSSFIYLASVLISSFEFFYSSIVPSSPLQLEMIMLLVSIAISAAAAFWLAIGLFEVSHRLRTMLAPSILLILLGIGELFILGAYATLVPNTNSLQTLLNEMTNPGSAQQLISQFGLMIVLGGFGGLLSIVGSVGLIMALGRSSKILGQPMIKYGLIAGIVLSLLDLLFGFPPLLVVSPLLIIAGARKFLEVELDKL